MAATTNKPIFDKRIFWDVNFETIDYDTRYAFVIERVFERGDVPDIRNCRRHYGDEKICKVLTNAKWLSLHKISLACAIFHNELTDYKSYNTAHTYPEGWFH
jgi:hypothetical protein